MNAFQVVCFSSSLSIHRFVYTCLKRCSLFLINQNCIASFIRLDIYLVYWHNKPNIIHFGCYVRFVSLSVASFPLYWTYSYSFRLKLIFIYLLFFPLEYSGLHDQTVFSTNIAFRADFSFHIVLESTYIRCFFSFWLLKTNAVENCIHHKLVFMLLL